MGTITTRTNDQYISQSH
jgi:hypothetical protein